MKVISILVLIAFCCAGCLGELRAGNLSFVNYDFWNKRYPPYDIMGRLQSVTYSATDSCKIESLSQTGTIPLVLWEEAFLLGCDTYSDLIDQIFALSNPLPEVIIFSSSEQSFDQYYSWVTHASEPYGKYLQIDTSTRFTIVSNQTANFLLNPLFNGTVNITNQQTAGEIFFGSAGWKAYVWIFFIIWVFYFLYAVVQVFYFFSGNRRFILNNRLLVFISGAISCLLRAIEQGVDPYKSTGLLGVYPYTFIWWCSFIFASYAVFSVLAAWIQVAQATSLHLSGKRRKSFIYFLRFLSVVITIGLLYLAVGTTSSNNPIVSLIGVIIYVILIVLCFFTIIFFSVFGYRVLKVLKSSNFSSYQKNGDQKKNFASQTTNLMIVAMITFFMLISTMIVVIVFVTALPIEVCTPAYIMTTRLFFEFSLLGMLGSLFGCLRFSDFGVRYLRSASQTSAKPQSTPNDNPSKPSTETQNETQTELFKAGESREGK